MRARRDGHTWKKGEWGLIVSDDPSYTWTSTPSDCPTFGMTDDEMESWFDDPARTDAENKRASGILPNDFNEAFNGNPVSGYMLVKAAMERGYDPEESGYFANWFYDYIGRYLVTANMTEEGDCFPEREREHPSDLTIGRT